MTMYSEVTSFFSTSTPTALPERPLQLADSLSIIRLPLLFNDVRPQSLQQLLKRIYGDTRQSYSILTKNLQ